MPPAITSEDEASASESEIPYRVVEKDTQQDSDEEGGDDDDESSDEYVVEKIISHLFDVDGTVKYEVKWLGYESKEDRTWEPEDNLHGAKDLLEEYFEKIGGRPVFKPKGSKKRKVSQGLTSTPESKATKGRRKSVKDEGEATPEVTSTPRPVRKEKENEWTIPQGTWENEVQSVDTIEEEADPKTGTRKRWAYIVWNNGKRTKHEIAVLYQKCPQKMLRYYESHLVFYTPAKRNGATKEMEE